MDVLLKQLISAHDREAVGVMLDTLVDIAQHCIDTDDTTRAASILALIIHYPMRPDTRALAEALFDDLETQLCPRVIFDARERALTITLDDLVRELAAAQPS
jgi:hypothetical protein